MSNKQSKQQYDLVIVGGGMVGASLSLALADSSYRIAVLEKFPLLQAGQPAKASGYDDRTLVLNPVSCELLRDLDLGDLLQRSEPITSIHVSDQGRFGRTLLHAGTFGLQWFGRVVEAHRLGHALLQKIHQHDNIDWLAPAELQDIERQADEVILQLQDRTIRTRLVIGADGGQSKVRDLFNLPYEVDDYQQIAITCNATPGKSHQQRAYERFTPDGPLAILPLKNISGANRRVGVVMIGPAALAEERMALSDQAFLQLIQDKLGYRLGVLQRIGQRSQYPLQLIRAVQNVAPRCLLMGNASHTIHPVSAQGFNLGLRDVRDVAQALRLHGQSAEADPGEVNFLQSIQALRQSDQDATVRYTDTLARLYTNPSAVAGVLRSGGLIAHQLLPAMQRRLVNSAMGYR